MEVRLILGEPTMIWHHQDRYLAAPARWRETAKREGWTPNGDFRPVAKDIVEKAKTLPKEQQKFNVMLLGDRLFGLQCRLEEAGWEGDVVTAYLAVGIALKAGQDFRVIQGIMTGRRLARQWLAAAESVPPEIREHYLGIPMYMLSGTRQRAWLRVKEWTDEFCRDHDHPEVLEYYSTPGGRVVGVEPENVEERVGFDWKHVSTIRFDHDGEILGCLCMGNPKDCPKYLKQGCRIHEIH